LGAGFGSRPSLCGFGGEFTSRPSVSLKRRSASFSSEGLSVMLSVLSRFPEIATRVAVYIATFNESEVQLTCAFAKALDDDGQKASAILHQFRNISDRIDVVADVCEKVDTLTAKMLLVQMPALRSAASTRNELAHGTYLMEGERLKVLTWLTAKNRKNVAFYPSVEELDAKLEALDRLNVRLRALWDGTEMTLPYRPHKQPRRGRRPKGGPQSTPQGSRPPPRPSQR
jgi:hypothetical protein